MSEEEFAGLGFAPGSAKGVRSFKVDKFGRLTGVTFSKVWRPGENSAECLVSDRWVTLTASVNRFVSALNGIQVKAPQYYFVDSGTSQASGGPISVSPSQPGKFSRRGQGKQSSIPAPSVKPSPQLPQSATEAVAEAESAAAVLVSPPHDFGTCSCGFYGYFDGSDDYHDRGRISAVVEAYGEVVIGTRGFRAMKARILAIRVKAEDDGVTGSMARKLAKNYAGVAIFDKFEDMVAAFPPDTSLEPSPETDPDFWTRS